MQGRNTDNVCQVLQILEESRRTFLVEGSFYGPEQEITGE